ncbi:MULTISPECIES: NUDIX domain-containing protein [unclassified Agrobacterium]|jgi:nudix-type nucleoside diphosphatase (YffH/AdpP family)|uniref:NUDIX domain-containing protein n=1 Tax=unclassified Agrobacterium TaxID=2632611 RepID=UPI00083E3EC6|nr:MULTISPECIES: NUDIX domain-containing protein [unclassified Agrobacterium]AOG10276.1 nudix-type nucleoside diphosphatase, YffH/AdpP family protein [Agrobacterium sp. RAC06]QGG90053.1 NUDIX domain-containing protein [Agrobacterium sp. MA01]
MSIFDKARIAILEDKTLWKGWSHLRGITFDFFREGRAPHRLSWEVFERRNASAILLHNVERDTVTLVRQLRIAAHLSGEYPYLLEVPAGFIDDGETALQAALREAQEETGFKIATATPAFAAFMSPGSVTEKLHGFYAAVTDADRIAAGGGLDDEQEDLEVIELSFSEALEMVEAGEIIDAKTIMLLQWAALKRSGRGTGQSSSDAM